MTALPGVRTPVLAHGVDLQLAGLRGMLAPAVAGRCSLAVAVVGRHRCFAGRWRASPTPRVVEAWGCGRELQTARMQYTATSFAEPVQRVFDDVLRPVQDLDVTHVAESRYFIESVTFANTRGRRHRAGALPPGHQRRPAVGQAARRLQPGSVHRYLAYGLGALVVVLVAVAVIG